ncbi:hypothetical protein N0V93_001808 [Gnomoniopsis smithogilvyi]|uniref:Uncharacterized protein n=1 Tax=Gnomoniopsis smithogilvyi TaxID=1191159 RepID=A0A9W8Z495_9PEZI|nr:hypothetical protein N0V93_001808 [Gnomoniopsis smithogilvyi]
MEPATTRGDETPKKGRLEILGAICDDNALWLAVKNRQLASFPSLLQQGVPMTARVLHAILESCTKQGSEFLDAWLREGGSVDGSLEAVQCLLAHGADVLAPSWSGLSALQAAQMCQRQDIVNELRKHIDQLSGQGDLPGPSAISEDSRLVG